MRTDTKMSILWSRRDVVPNDGADVPTEGAEEMMSLTILECLFVSISGNS